MNKILTHKEFGGTYDFDGTQLTCVLRLFDKNDGVRYERFDYSYNPNDYEEIDVNHWEMKKYGSYACKYFLEDGSRPFKKHNCLTCRIKDKCMYHDKYNINKELGGE